MRTRTTEGNQHHAGDAVDQFQTLFRQLMMDGGDQLGKTKPPQQTPAHDGGDEQHSFEIVLEAADQRTEAAEDGGGAENGAGIGDGQKDRSAG